MSAVVGIKIINVDLEILGGTPVFAGTRVPIKNLFDYLETGETIEDFLDDFESVQREQVIKLLELSHRLIESSTEILPKFEKGNAYIRVYTAL